MNIKTQHYIDLIIVLTRKELKVRYRNSVLGFFWSIAHPLALALVFFFAFKMVMRIKMEHYSLFLIAGLFSWQWFGNSVNLSPLAFITNASIIKKVYFPRNIILFASVLQDMIHFFMSIPVIVAFMLVYHTYPTLSWLYGVPCLAIIQFLLIYGISLAISSINLFFRDLERLTVICTSLLFYFTPVFYPETMIPPQFRHLLYFHPMALIISQWRNLFLKGEVAPLPLAISFGEALVVFLVGYAIYRKLSWKFAEAV